MFFSYYFAKHMSNYTKKSPYWLAKRRMANDKKFARMRPIEKAKILQRHTRLTLYWLFALCILLFGMAIIFWENVFLYIGTLPFCVWGLLFVFYIKRKLKLRRYYSIASLQHMDPFDFEEYIVTAYNRVGFSLGSTPPSGDNGADGRGKDPKGTQLILQVKRYADHHTV